MRLFFFFFFFVRGVVVVVVAFVVAPLTLRERASVLATPVTQSIKSFRRWPHHPSQNRQTFVDDQTLRNTGRLIN